MVGPHPLVELVETVDPHRLGIHRLVTDQAAQAHADLLDLTIELGPYEVLAPRAWELRRNLTVYDAGYVALAEFLGAALVTLDHIIAEAPGLRCEVASR